MGRKLVSKPEEVMNSACEINAAAIRRRGLRVQPGGTDRMESLRACLADAHVNTNRFFLDDWAGGRKAAVHCYVLICSFHAAENGEEAEDRYEEEASE